MYQAVAHFNYQNFEQDPVTLISQTVNQWRINGQILGREFGVTFHQDHFEVNLAIPEQESLLPKWNNEQVKEALLQAEEFGVNFAGFEIVGQDYQADETASHLQPDHLILYTTHLDSCSPIRSGQDLKPIPVYRLLKEQPELAQAIIQWQENWQACDQLQMNGTVLEKHALQEISEIQSALSQQGLALSQAITEATGISVFYYLYRLGKDPEIEQNRPCPNCGKKWRLAKPLHEIFHFKCNDCRLISNLSWELL